MNSHGFDPRLIVQALEAYANVQPKGPEGYFKVKAIEKQIAWFKQPESGNDLARRGGDHLGSIRNWMQWEAFNGDSVIWGSTTDVLRLKHQPTPAMFEEIACKVAAAVLNEMKVKP